MSTKNPENAEAGAAAELAKLRGQVVAQARELALIRWEISSLMRRHPFDGLLNQLKYSTLRRLPKLARTIGRTRQALRTMLPSVRRWRLHSPGAGAARGQGFAGLFRGRVLLVGENAVTQQIVADQQLVEVSSGAGFTRSLSVPQPDEPVLRAPAAGSLVKWLVDDASQLQRVGTIVVEAGDAVSLGLIRGRLREGQILALAPSTDQSGSTSSLIAELGEPELQDMGLAFYTRLPPGWLDPLDESHRPLPAVVSSQTWPKISVIMVSFNQGTFLEEGLRSVLDQGYPNLEFIVIDGNSTDGSVDILNRYRHQLADLVIEPDRGQSDGLNKGFTRATGEILTWVNSDDLLEPGALFRAAQAFVGHAVDLVVGGCRQIGRTRGTVILNHHNRLPFGIPVALPLGLLLEMDRFWLTGSFFYQPEVFFTRDIWKRAGGKLRTDLSYILDYDLWVRMAAAGAIIVHIPEFLACSRTHDQQKTTMGMPYMPEVQRLLQEYASRLINPP